jgi:hypothetical protein
MNFERLKDLIKTILEEEGINDGKLAERLAIEVYASYENSLWYDSGCSIGYD